MTKPLRVYLSGALTDLNEKARQRQLERYELIQRVCMAEVYEWYCPHQHSDPVRNADMLPTKVHALDSANVRDSDLVIADCTEPSFGVGIEAQMADCNATPILLIAQQGKKISRLMRGIPNVIRVDQDADVLYFSTNKMLAVRLAEELRLLRPRLLEARRGRVEREASMMALAEYARTHGKTYVRHCQLRAAVATAGAKLPTTVAEWEQLDHELD